MVTSQPLSSHCSSAVSLDSLSLPKIDRKTLLTGLHSELFRFPGRADLDDDAVADGSALSNPKSVRVTQIVSRSARYHELWSPGGPKEKGSAECRHRAGRGIFSGFPPWCQRYNLALLGRLPLVVMTAVLLALKGAGWGVLQRFALSGVQRLSMFWRLHCLHLLQPGTWPCVCILCSATAELSCIRCWHLLGAVQRC